MGTTDQSNAPPTENQGFLSGETATSRSSPDRKRGGGLDGTGGPTRRAGLCGTGGPARAGRAGKPIRDGRASPYGTGGPTGRPYRAALPGGPIPGGPTGRTKPANSFS